MTIEEMIKKAHETATANPGYSYNSEVLESVCRAGYEGLPDQFIAAQKGTQTVTIDKARGVMVIADNGVEIQAVPLTEELKDNAVILDACRQSRRGW